MTEIPIRCFAVSAVVLRHAPGGVEFLLLRRLQTLVGEWCQVAGKIEADEKAWQAALREIKEETGLIPSRLYSADICEQFYEADLDVISMLPVFVAFVDIGASVTLNGEHSEYRWLAFDEAIQLVPFAGQRNVLKHVNSEFVLREPQEHLRIKG